MSVNIMKQYTDLTKKQINAYMKLVFGNKFVKKYCDSYSQTYLNIRYNNFNDDNTKHLKGFIYDSLAYRYISAREQMAEYEFTKDSKKEHDKAYYQRQANRDIMRFCQILDEAIGEHD